MGGSKPFAKTICFICYQNLKPAVENLQSISICGQVFHELCLQKWFEHSLKISKNYYCPFCRQSCEGKHAIRLYFQSVEDQCDPEEEDWEKMLLGETNKLNAKASELCSAFQYQKVPKEINNLARPTIKPYRKNGRPIFPSYRKFEESLTIFRGPKDAGRNAVAIGGCQSGCSFVLRSSGNVKVSNKRQVADPLSSGLDNRNYKGAKISKVDTTPKANPALELKGLTMSQTNEPYSIGHCIAIINRMQGVDRRLYDGAVDLFQNQVWRETFVLRESEKRLNWLKAMLLSA
ncbi:hypothetical protein REPUB_Repub09cG0195900 [Reevesia pubescens]